MAAHRLFIMQTSFDGLTYTKGTPIDTLASYNVVCKEFPFKLYPETKDVVTNNWRGSHGLDVYIPAENKIKDYDIDVQFLYLGTHAQMRTQIEQFFKFLHGLAGPVVISGNSTTVTPPAGARLAIYDEYTQIGRKDVRVASIEPGGWWDMPDFDTDAIADFKVRFHVYDPVTDVTPVLSSNKINNMTWAE